MIQVPLASPRERRTSSTGRASSPTSTTGAIAGLSTRAATAVPARRRRRVTNQCHDITVFPEVGLAAGACSGNGILLDIRDPKNPVRLDARSRHELRVLALGHVQQRRHEGDLHRRMGRRRATPLPRDRSAELGRRRDLRHRRSQAAVQGLLQDAGAADRARRTAWRTTARSSRCRDATSWSRRGIRAASRCSISPTRRTPVEIAFFDRGPIDAKQLILGGLLVGVLVQRPDLRLRDRARDRRVQAEAERVSLAERDRRREHDPIRGAQHAGTDAVRRGRRASWWRARTSISSRAARASSRRAPLR